MGCPLDSWVECHSFTPCINFWANNNIEVFLEPENDAERSPKKFRPGWSMNPYFTINLYYSSDPNTGETCIEQHCIKWSPYPVLGGQLSKSPICFFLITAIFTSNEQVTYYNPSIPMSDQDRISPCSINTISSRQVMRIKENIS